MFGPPKTPSSSRVLPLPESVSFELARHLAQFDAGADGLIFTTSNGAPVRRNVWIDAFSRAARGVGVKATTLDLRHHAASVLIEAGASVKAVQRFLGHATASETLDTYAHLWPDSDDRIRAIMDAAFRPVEDTLRTGAASEGR